MEVEKKSANIGRLFFCCSSNCRYFKWSDDNLNGAYDVGESSGVASNSPTAKDEIEELLQNSSPSTYCGPCTKFSDEEIEEDDEFKASKREIIREELFIARVKVKEPGRGGAEEEIPGGMVAVELEAESVELREIRGGD
ncbi:hypothetical protein Fot_05826 [Forsythia ovata]|uniref:Zinc finger GRF-type domain-containing protein n=1 Tax=Forsythia ovata TaxID=205694 RepID=A0ABD1WR80_9LAMI